MSNVLTGPDLKLYINNRPFGKAVSVAWRIHNGVHAIRTVDDLLPAELADGPITVSGSVEVIRLRNDGGLEGQGLVALPAEHTLGKYITIHVLDRRSDSIVFQTGKVRVTDQSWQARPRSLLLGTFTFEGIGYVNETASSNP